MVSTVPKPQCFATASTCASDPSSAIRACSTRIISALAAGVMPVSRRKARAKLRGLIDARAASAATDRSEAGFAAIQSWTARSGSPPRPGVALRARRRDLRAELRLATGATKEDHELLCDGAGAFGTEVFFYKGKRQVDA